MKKKLLIIVILILIAIFGKNLYTIFMFYKTVESRLTINTNSTKFDIDSYLKIDKRRISSECEVYNVDDFFEYNCKIDSIYSLTIINVGEISKLNLVDSIYLSKIDLPFINGNLNMVVTTAHPIDNTHLYNHSPRYNVIKLPMKKISKVVFFVDGKIIRSEYDSIRKLVVFDLTAKRTTISFNNIKNTYLSFSNSNENELVSLFFFENQNQLYVGFLSSSNKNGIVLRQIESSNPQFEPLIFENTF